MKFSRKIFEFMARYEYLPIYKAAFDLNVYVEQIVRHFSRYHTYTLGTELRSIQFSGHQCPAYKQKDAKAPYFGNSRL